MTDVYVMTDHISDFTLASKEESQLLESWQFLRSWSMMTVLSSLLVTSSYLLLKSCSLFFFFFFLDLGQSSIYYSSIEVDLSSMYSSSG